MCHREGGELGDPLIAILFKLIQTQITSAFSFSPAIDFYLSHKDFRDTNAGHI